MVFWDLKQYPLFRSCFFFTTLSSLGGSRIPYTIGGFTVCNVLCHVTCIYTISANKQNYSIYVKSAQVEKKKLWTYNSGLMGININTILVVPLVVISYTSLICMMSCFTVVAC